MSLRNQINSDLLLGHVTYTAGKMPARDFDNAGYRSVTFLA